MPDITKEPFKAKERGKLIRELKTDMPYHVINYLNKKEISVLDLDTFQKSPFFYALDLGSFKTVDYFLNQKLVPLEEPLFSMRSGYQTLKGAALHFVCNGTSYNPLEMITVLIGHNANIDAPAEQKLHLTPLVLAIENSKNPFQKEVISSLVAAGANCLQLSKNKSNPYGSPFSMAIAKHNPPAVYSMLEGIKTIEQLETAKIQAKTMTSYKMPNLVLEIETIIEKRKIENALPSSLLKPKVSSKI